MKRFRADLHIHSVLSPCGDLGMSPIKIIEEAKRRNIDILGLTDHNATHHCRLTIELGRKAGILVLPGAEVNTREEIHCLTFFENIESTDLFQEYLDNHLPRTQNDPSLFGDQLIVNQEEHIIDVVQPLLISALKKNLYEVRDEVKRLKGILIPAHIDRPYNSLLSQLGFIPDDLKQEALEVSGRYSPEEFRQRHPELKELTLINNSDAHTLSAIGTAATEYQLKEASFQELLMALRNEGGRKICHS